MKDIYKNPTLYYILVPAVATLWPLLVWSVYLPSAEESWLGEKAQYEKAQSVIAEILALDPDRLAFADSKTTAAEFDYATAVEKTAASCGIPPTDYRLSSGIIITSAGRKSQNAKVALMHVDLTKFARFLSTIQLRWPNLQCARLKLTKKKTYHDTWDADLDFKYYY